MLPGAAVRRVIGLPFSPRHIVTLWNIKRTRQKHWHPLPYVGIHETNLQDFICDLSYVPREQYRGLVLRLEAANKRWYTGEMWDLLPNSIKLPRISDAKVSHFHSCSPFEELVTCPLLPSFLIFCHRPLLLDSQMSQELGITEKSPDFTNPYRTERDDVSKMQACWSTLCLFYWL